MQRPLTTRQEVEKQYHNLKYRHDSEFVPSNSESAYRYYFKRLSCVNGCKVLDFGCGDGWSSIKLAKEGANVIGIDISEELIRRAKKRISDEGLDNSVKFYVMSGEDLEFEDGLFDLVVGSAILHHTDIAQAINNIHRVLKQDGRGIFIEPMNQNILLKMWRILTPWRRSSVERALLLKDIKSIKNKFRSIDIKYFYLFSVYAEGLKLLFPKSEILEKIGQRLNKFDDYFLEKFPFLGKYCAVVVLEMKKK